MNNAAAIGYALIAAKEWLKIDGDKLVQLEQAMRSAMEFHTEEEAEDVYNKN